MKLSELKTFGRAIVPAAKISTISNALFELILREGAIDVAKETMCLPTSTKFTATAGNSVYLLTSIASNILTIDKSGLWWYNGTQWKQLFARTRQWMDDNVQNWRDRASGTPNWWFREGNEITVIPAPSSTLADGFWLYYGKKPPVMGSDDHYPFGGALEIVHLTTLSHNILDYWRWKAFEILGEAGSAEKAQAIYRSKLPMARDFVLQNAALLAQNGKIEAKMKGRPVC